MIAANYRKKCPGCGEQIEEGDQIGKVDGDWVCADCVEECGGEDMPRDPAKGV